MEHESSDIPEPDPESSPFELQATSGGMPYKRGGEEDLAIRRVLEEADRERAARRRRD
jgi:hypothetical protein